MQKLLKKLNSSKGTNPITAAGSSYTSPSSNKQRTDTQQINDSVIASRNDDQQNREPDVRRRASAVLLMDSPLVDGIGKKDNYGMG
jgi:hypothetical protein